MLYYRLFKPETPIRYSIIFGIALSFLVYFGNMTVVAIACAPGVGHPWDWTTAVKCSRSTIFGFYLGIANVALDVFLLILPIPVILQLQLSTKKKFGVLAIFMVGLLWAQSFQVSRAYLTFFIVLSLQAS